MGTRALSPARFGSWCAAFLALLSLCLLVAATTGAGEVSLWDLVRDPASLSPTDRAVLLAVRAPRVLLAAVIGGALSVAGLAFQALLKNPLADPYVLGVSGGASLGGVVALLSGVTLGSSASGAFASLAVPICAFAGAFLSLLLIEWVATVDGSLSVTTILLTGAVFNAFSGACIFFLQSVASLHELHAIVFYLMGSVPSLEFESVAALALCVLGATAVVASMARDYNLLSIGEEGAMQLGVAVERVKRRTFVVGALLVGLCVSVAGLIGFVGLVVPHILRLAVGPDHRLLVPASFLFGGAFLVLADLLCRVLVMPSELPVGVVTALLGGPFFLYLLRVRNREAGFGWVR